MSPAVPQRTLINSLAFALKQRKQF